MPRERPRSRSAYRWLWLLAIVLAIALLALWYLRRPNHEESRPPMLPTTEWTAAPKEGAVAVDLPGPHDRKKAPPASTPPVGTNDPGETADPVATPLPAQ